MVAIFEEIQLDFLCTVQTFTGSSAVRLLTHVMYFTHAL